MTRRDDILDAARRLTVERGVVPSLNATADAADVSKGGLTHHFPSRAALVAGLARLALDEVDVAMAEAAARGDAAATWLRIAVPSGDDTRLFRALATSHGADLVGPEVLAAAEAAIVRWERLIADEVGDAARARVIRLVGDGLAANVVAGVEAAPDAAALDEILSALGIDSRSGS